MDQPPKKTGQINMRVDDRDMRLLRMLATRRGVTMSQVVRDLIKEDLARLGLDAKPS